jgi:hypothetical protein
MRMGLLRRRRRRREHFAPAAPPSAGLGEPPAVPDSADDAELDELRGELVRELDRLANRHGDAAPRV